MAENPPEFVVDSLVEDACRLAKLHGVRPLDLIAFELGILAQLAGPPVTFEGRAGSLAWPLLLVSQTDEAPPWLEAVVGPLRAGQRQLGNEVDGVIKQAYPAGTARLMIETAAHLRGFGELFEPEALKCESGARVAANPPASTFVHFVDGDGPLLPRKGPRQAGDGVAVIINGNSDVRSLRRAGESERAVARHLRHPDLEPRVLLAARWPEKSACRLVRGHHKLRIEGRPLLLPVVTGHRCEGDFSALLSRWRHLVGTILSRRYPGVPWQFEPADRISARVTEAGEEINALIGALCEEAKGWAAVLKELPWKLVGLAHHLEHVHGSPGARHGNHRLATIAAHLAVMIAKGSVRWLGQVLPHPELGLTEHDTLVCDYVRRFAPLTSGWLLRRMPDLRAAGRDRALERLVRAGHLTLHADGVIRCPAR